MSQYAVSFDLRDRSIHNQNTSMSLCSRVEKFSN